MNPGKTLEQVLAGSRNVRFRDAVRLAEAFGFRLARVRGDHHIFIHPEVPDLLNLQSVHGQAKPYQLRQLLSLVEHHSLRMKGDQE